MAKKVKVKSSSKNSSYLTKRILVSAAKSGIRKAAKETMKVMGYTVIVENGWVVRKNSDGTIERLEEIIPSEHINLNLD